MEHINSVINSRNKYYNRLTSDKLMNHYKSVDRIIVNQSNTDVRKEN